jgi:hypothetical protein
VPTISPPRQRRRPPSSPGYYIVKWLGCAYTLQEDELEIDSSTVEEGTLVAKCEYLNPVPRGPGWYTPSPSNETHVRVAHVLHTGMALLHLRGEQAPDLLRRAAGNARRRVQGRPGGARGHLGRGGPPGPPRVR